MAQRIYNTVNTVLLGWLARHRTYQLATTETAALALRPLHQADLDGPLCAVAGRYFISYRPKVRWDAGLPHSMVEVHTVGIADAHSGLGRVSNLVATLQAGETWTNAALGDSTWVRVDEIDDTFLRAKVTIGHQQTSGGQRVHFARDGKPPTNQEMLQILRHAYDRPILGGNRYQVEQGAWAAVVKTGQEQGELSATMLLQAMQGNPVSTLPVTQNSRGQRIINVTALERHGIVPRPTVLRGATLVRQQP